jgi:hypothetical protein
MKNQFISPKKLLAAKFLLTLFVIDALDLFFNATNAQAQDGNAGLQEATTMVQGYFSTGCNLMYAIGAVVGIVGAIKVYSKWSAGEPDIGKVAGAWFGGCIFLVVVAAVLKSFFGQS